MGFGGDFLVFGHRGAAGLAPENTLCGFQRAAGLGVDAVELDVHVVERRLVVIHDDTVDRTTDGRGAVARHTLAALRGLDAGDGERIPLLEEVLACLPAAVGVNIELKGQGTGATLAAALVEAGRDVLVSSFNLAELADFQRRRPEVRCAPLFNRRRATMLEVAQTLCAWSINVADRLVDAAFVGKARGAGLRTLVYTVNDLARARELAAWGAKGVFTDFPDRVSRAGLAGGRPGPS